MWPSLMQCFRNLSLHKPGPVGLAVCRTSRKRVSPLAWTSVSLPFSGTREKGLVWGTVVSPLGL